MATQKITMGRNKDTDYESKKASAMQQADAQNSFMWGLQTAMNEGFGTAVQMNRSPKYGNTNFVTGDALDGSTGNFKPNYDSAGNTLIADPMNQTGYLDGQASSTLSPQQDPAQMGLDAAQRVAMIASGHQYQGHNNRQQIYGA